MWVEVSVEERFERGEVGGNGGEFLHSWFPSGGFLIFVRLLKATTIRAGIPTTSKVKPSELSVTLIITR